MKNWDYILLAVYAAALTLIFIVRAHKYDKRRQRRFDTEYPRLEARAKEAREDKDLRAVFADAYVFKSTEEKWAPHQESCFRWLNSYIDAKLDAAKLWSAEYNKLLAAQQPKAIDLVRAAMKE